MRRSSSNPRPPGRPDRPEPLVVDGGVIESVLGESVTRSVEPASCPHKGCGASATARSAAGNPANRDGLRRPTIEGTELLRAAGAGWPLAPDVYDFMVNARLPQDFLEVLPATYAAAACMPSAVM